MQGTFPQPSGLGWLSIVSMGTKHNPSHSWEVALLGSSAQHAPHSWGLCGPNLMWLSLLLTVGRTLAGGAPGEPSKVGGVTGVEMHPSISSA